MFHFDWDADFFLPVTQAQTWTIAHKHYHLVCLVPWNLSQGMFTCSLLLWRIYCFMALFGGINELLSPTFLFFNGPPESSSLVSCWRFWDPLSITISSLSSHNGAWVWVAGTGVWRSLSWANLHLIPNLHFPSFLYNTHILFPPICEGLGCIVRGTCFCNALRFWSAWALKGLLNTLLSEWVLRSGGGSLLGMFESIWRAGSSGGPVALGTDAFGESCEDESSSVSDSLSDSLEPEPGSNRKLRLLVVDEDAPEGLEDTQDRQVRTNNTALKRLSSGHVLIEHSLNCNIINSNMSIILGLWRQSVANQRGHLFNDLARGS